MEVLARGKMNCLRYLSRPSEFMNMYFKQVLVSMEAYPFNHARPAVKRRSGAP